jgi:CBS domain-containing protein
MGAKKLDTPLVKDFMTPPTGVVSIDTPIDQVIDFLLKEEITNTPVVQSKNKRILVGSISEQDCLDYLTSEFFYNIPDITANAVMNKLPVCVAPDTDIFTVANTFVKFGFCCLPVVKKMELIGMVSRHETLRRLRSYHLELEKLIGKGKPRPNVHELVNHRFIIK